MERAAWLQDDLHLALLGIPSLAHDIEIDHTAAAGELQILMLVDAGFHLHGVGPLWAVTVVRRGPLENGCRQIGLQVGVVGWCEF